MDFTKKVVLVTGASSGIGAATSIEFAKLGAQVVVTGRNVESLKRTAKLCDISTGGKMTTLVIPADLTKQEDMQRLVKEMMDKIKRLNVLINCAGVFESGSIENTSLQQFDRIMGLNMRAVYHLTMLTVPELIKTKGNIINVSCVNGLRAFPSVLSYNISKAALDQFTRCVALELAPKGVRCNSVNPGVTVTELHKRSGMDEQMYKKFLERSKDTHAMGRVAKVEDVTGLICFLASDLSSFVTAANVPIDGGRHVMCPR